MNTKLIAEAFRNFSKGFILLADAFDSSESEKERTYLLGNVQIAQPCPSETLNQHEDEDIEEVELEETDNEEIESEEVDNVVDFVNKKTHLMGNVQVAQSSSSDEELEDIEDEDEDDVIEEPKTEKTQINNAQVTQPTMDDIEEKVHSKLMSMTLEQLAEVCTDFDLSTKGRKMSLVDRIIDSIDIYELADYLFSEAETEEELDETTKMYIESIELTDDETVEEICKMEKIKGGKKALIQAVREKKVDISKYFEEEEEVEEDKEDYLPEDTYSKGELKVVQEIDEQIKSGDITIRKIRKFLEKYVDKKELSNLSDEDSISLYKRIHANLVDDDGVKHDFEDGYIKNGEFYCCGQQIKRLEGNLYVCEVCGTEYEVD